MSTRESRGKPSGTYLGALRQERIDADCAAAVQAREKWERAITWARRHFTAKQAYYAAAAVVTRGSAKPSVVRAHLEATHPELFTDKEVAECPSSSSM
jgi:hypothetical protein